MDIVARLRDEAVDYEWDGIDGSLSEWPLLIEAADEITRLRTKNEILTTQRDEARALALEWSNDGGAEIERLRAEVEALKPDAERWRFFVYFNRVDPTKLPDVDVFIPESEANEIIDKAIADLRGEGE